MLLTNLETVGFIKEIIIYFGKGKGNTHPSCFPWIKNKVVKVIILICVGGRKLFLFTTIITIYYIQEFGGSVKNTPHKLDINKIGVISIVI